MMSKQGRYILEVTGLYKKCTLEVVFRKDSGRTNYTRRKFSIRGQTYVEADPVQVRAHMSLPSQCEYWGNVTQCCAGPHPKLACQKASLRLPDLLVASIEAKKI